MQIWIQNAKITLWKNFGQFFQISSILAIRSGYAKKDNFSILVVNQNIWDLHKYGLQIWIQNTKITLWKNFGQFFPISSILVIRSAYAKKGQFSILAVFQNVWDLHKFGLQIWIHNAKITLWKNFLTIFPISLILDHQVRVCEKRPVFNISCNSKYMWIYINLGCRFEFTTQKLPHERILGNFSNFINFGNQVRICEKRSVSQY